MCSILGVKKNAKRNTNSGVHLLHLSKQSTCADHICMLSTKHVYNLSIIRIYYVLEQKFVK